jgi:hypothetical protein
MQQQQIVQYLSAKGLFGRWYQKWAIRVLLRFNNPKAMSILASTLDQPHVNNAVIIEALSRITLAQGNDGVETLWKIWIAHPKPALAELLTYIGWPHERALDKRLAQNILATINEQNAPIILNAILRLIEFLPKGDSTINDGLYALWIYSQSNTLEQLIDRPEYKPGSPAMETLYFLVTGQIDRYLALNDYREQLFTQAVKLAPPAFLERITQIVGKEKNLSLIEKYRTALIQAKIEFTQLLYHLKLIGDEIGLFKQIPNMNLGQVLELCERWSKNLDLINEFNIKNVIQPAIEAYSNIQKPYINSNLVLPEGIVDIFTYWQNNHVDGYYRSSNDPFIRAKNLYVNRSQQHSMKTNDNKHWLEKLVIRLTDITITNNDNDIVCWLTTCNADAKLLYTNVNGTPTDYMQNKKLLQDANEFTSSRTLGLLAILCTFQAAFIGTEIIVETMREPSDHTALRMEDYDETIINET